MTIHEACENVKTLKARADELNDVALGIMAEMEDDESKRPAYKAAREAYKAAKAEYDTAANALVAMDKTPDEARIATAALGLRFPK
jgi:ubiquitin-protein ligase